MTWPVVSASFCPMDVVTARAESEWRRKTRIFRGTSEGPLSKPLGSKQQKEVENTARTMRIHAEPFIEIICSGYAPGLGLKSPLLV